jgi:NADH-quinone oxidoreductase subunit H
MHDFNLLYTILTIVGVLGALLTTCGFLIYAERKVAAWVQDRIGPNRVGPWGLLQSVADGLKFLFKEDIIPRQVDKPLFLLAPAISLMTALLAFAVVPFGPTEPPPRPPAPLTAQQRQDPAQVQAYQERVHAYEQEAAQYRSAYQFVLAPGIDLGILFVFAVASLNVYGIILGGWAGNNKYSFIGGLRSSAQIISYEIPMGMAILGILLLIGSLNLEWMIQEQAQPEGRGWWAWNICFQPLAFLLFMVSSFAETNRLPFDLPEAEQELVGGYHTEYSAMKFAMFFLAEYTSVVTTSFIMVIAFFGGWHFPWIAEPGSFWLVRLIVFGVKMSFFILLFMWVRWTLPRFRFDQLMGLAWKVLIPLALANLVCVMVVKEFRLSLWWLLPASVLILVAAAWIATMLPRAPPGLKRRLPAREAAEVGALPS